MAQILYNYAVFKGYDVSAQSDLSAFGDGSETSDWALPAMKWAVWQRTAPGLRGQTESCRYGYQSGSGSDSHELLRKNHEVK